MTIGARPHLQDFFFLNSAARALLQVLLETKKQQKKTKYLLYPFLQLFPQPGNNVNPPFPSSTTNCRSPLVFGRGQDLLNTDNFIQEDKLDYFNGIKLRPLLSRSIIIPW